MIIIISRILLLAFCLKIVFFMPFLNPYPTGNWMYFRFILVLLVTIESLNLFKNFFIDKKLSKFTTNIFTIFLSFYLLFMGLESFFMFFPLSHGSHETLASKLWTAKYWHPINSLGFRDVEPGNSDSVILFVGDSFTEGDGLENPDDRFSNIVGNELRNKNLKYRSVNIGKDGLDTRDEYEEMINFIAKTKIQPKKIILQYYGNDIEQVAARNGIEFKSFTPYAEIPLGFLRRIIKGSYFLDFIYWMLPKSYDVPYTVFLTQAYKNNDVFSKHKKDLNLFIDYANENSLQLIVVILPLLRDLELSNSLYIDDLVTFFSKNGIGNINVSQLTKDMPVKDRVVNFTDDHASKKVNRIVAQEIFKKLKLTN